MTENAMRIDSSSCRIRSRSAVRRRTFPEANPLVPLRSFAERSGTPTSKSIVISIKSRQEFAGTFD
jgi:hypothetical protein